MGRGALAAAVPTPQSYNEQGGQGPRRSASLAQGTQLVPLVGKLKPDGSYDFCAVGHLGQRIYVSPPNKAVVVRFGISDEGVDSWEDVLASIVEKIK